MKILISPAKSLDYESKVPTEQHSNPFFLDKAVKLNKSLRQKNHKQWEVIQKEDIDIIQGMQTGRNSPIYNGGNFSPIMDNPTHHFHKWVAQNII